ncbi:MAG: hypothetical protein PVJ64_03095 [Gemmatimonadales bacterium]|jgi:hypothetical protein
MTGQTNFLYTDIGRGHPHYLDGIIECLPPEHIGTVSDVFAETSGLARAAWRLARSVYQYGGRSPALSALYNRLRAQGDYNRGGTLQGIMGRPLRRRYVDDPLPLVVAHPILAAILRDKQNLLYQHGELAAPRESWVKGQHRTIVPTARTADAFIAAGIAADSLFVSGLCIEPALLEQAEAAFNARLDRLAGSDPLCGAFFSSGAEPRRHVASLAAAARSAVAAGGRAIVFARRGGALKARLTRMPGERAGLTLCLYDGRQELNQLTQASFADFDYFVAPAHERTHWTLGLGLPMFVVGPSLGSFSPLNRELLLTARVAKTMDDEHAAAWLGKALGRLQQTGELRAMAEAGWGRFDRRGFDNIAEMLGSL